MSARPSVRLSVTLVIYAKMVQDIEICSAPYHKTTSIVETKFRNLEFRGSPRTNALNRGTSLSTAKSDQRYAASRKRYKTRSKLLLHGILALDW